MITFTLYRYEYSPICTKGILQVEGIYACDTLELPWRNNEHDISCIPEGTYSIRQYLSVKNGNCIYVDGVPGRTGIEIHIGNSISNTSGCILVGVKSKDLVLQSTQKLSKLLTLLGLKSGMLEIKRL